MLFILALLLAYGCQERADESRRDTATIVFKHGKMAGDPRSFRALLDRFEQENPGLRVRDETLPSSTDEQHQFYAINLQAKSRDFDVLSLDVIWVSAFARAGWIKDISHLITPGERQSFFPGPLEAVTFNDRVYAIPWYIDAGVLYYRKDLLEKYSLPVPRTWQELAATAREISSREKGIYGYLWQGRQYEGLVCNALEFIWSNGGEILEQGRPVINAPRNAEALTFMADLIGKYGVSPPLVTTATEEPTRELFGSGKAVFMRNWPYAWALYNRPGAVLRSKVGIAPLPSFPGHESASTLGGWQLGVNRYSPNPNAAEKLVRFLTSPESQKRLALAVGYNPARRALYKDPDLLREHPGIASLYAIFMKARPRPVTPYYLMITQVLQPEFSAAISEIKNPEAALASAQQQVSRILEMEQ